MALPWDDLVQQHLSRFRSPLISAADVDLAERWVLSQGVGMQTLAGAWRLKLVNGTPYVKMLKMRPSWMERGSVLRLVLDAIATSTAPLPDVDAVYGSADQDASPAHLCGRRILVGDAWPECNRTTRAVQVPMLVNAIQRRLSNRGSIPLPEFTWVGWKQQPPWCVLSKRLALVGGEAAGGGLPWEARIDSAYFSGSLSNGKWRRRLARLYERLGGGGGLLHVRHAQAHHETLTLSLTLTLTLTPTLTLTLTCGMPSRTMWRGPRLMRPRCSLRCSSEAPRRHRGRRLPRRRVATASSSRYRALATAAGCGSCSAAAPWWSTCQVTGTSSNPNPNPNPNPGP